MLLNIVFGIIIDTFGELRDKIYERKDKWSNECFICDLTRSDFEIQSLSFENHVKKEHNKWLYVYFILYISTKDQLEMDGNELLVYARILAKNTQWMPKEETQYLIDDNEEIDEDEQNIWIKKNNSKVNSLEGFHKEMQTSLAALRNSVNE